MDDDMPKCNLLKPRDFDNQYSYYLERKNDVYIFSIYWSLDINPNVSYTGALGVFIAKILLTHFPEQNNDNVIRIYLPNYSTPITKLIKSPCRIECTKDLILTLNDDYKLELL